MGEKKLFIFICLTSMTLSWQNCLVLRRSFQVCLLSETGYRKHQCILHKNQERKSTINIKLSYEYLQNACLGTTLITTLDIRVCKKINPNGFSLEQQSVSVPSTLRHVDHFYSHNSEVPRIIFMLISLNCWVTGYLMSVLQLANLSFRCPCFLVPFWFYQR